MQIWTTRPMIVWARLLINGHWVLAQQPGKLMKLQRIVESEPRGGDKCLSWQAWVSAFIQFHIHHIPGWALRAIKSCPELDVRRDFRELIAYYHLNTLPPWSWITTLRLLYVISVKVIFSFSLYSRGPATALCTNVRPILAADNSSHIKLYH